MGVDFNGTSQFMSAPWAATSPYPRTFAGWVRAGSLASWRTECVMGHGNPTVAEQFEALDLKAEDYEPAPQGFCFNNPAAALYTASRIPNLVDPHFIMVRFTESQIQVRLDGGAWLNLGFGPSTVNYTHIYLGRTVAPDITEFFSGVLEHAMGWNALLTDSEAEQLRTLAVDPATIQPSALLFYKPLKTDLADAAGSSLTWTSTDLASPTFVDLGINYPGAVQTYGVTYNANGATSGTPPVDSSSPYEEGNQVVVLSAGTLARPGYTFSGWNTAANGSGIARAAGSTFSMPAASVTLYAQWVRATKIINHETVDPSVLSNAQVLAAAALKVYMEHASTGQDILGDSDVDSSTGLRHDDVGTCGLALLYAQDNRYLMPRYSLASAYDVSWFETHSGLQTNNRGNPTPAIKLSGFQTDAAAVASAVNVAMFKYCWIDVWDGTYGDTTTGYVANGASKAQTDITAVTTLESTYGITIPFWTMPIESGRSFPARQAYNDAIRTYCAANNHWLFDLADIEAWTTDGTRTLDANSREVAVADYVEADQGHLNSTGALRAAGAFWNLLAGIAAESAPTTFTITFNANGGSGSMSSQTSEAGSVTLATNSFTRAGYTFAGWNTASGGSGTFYADGASYPLSADVILYAQWTAITHTITYSANGGSGTMAPQVALEGAVTLTPNAFVRSGYSFNGWNTASGGWGTAYANNSTISLTTDLTLYAQWLVPPTPRYTLSFDANGGEGTMSPIVQEAGTVTVPACGYIRAGYTFVSWNTVADGSGTAYAEDGLYPLSANAVLHAIWVAQVTSLGTYIMSQVQDTVASGYLQNYVTHRLATSNKVLPSYRNYKISHPNGDYEVSKLVPCPFGDASNPSTSTLGRFSLSNSLAVNMYATTVAPLTPVSTIPFQSSTVVPGSDVIIDEYVTDAPRRDTALITSATRGYVQLEFDTDAPVVTVMPSTTVLNGAIGILFPLFSGTAATLAEIVLEGTFVFEVDANNKLVKAVLTVYAIPEINPITGLTNYRSLIGSDTRVSSGIGNSAKVYTYNEGTSTWDLLTTRSWVAANRPGYLDTQELSHLGVVFPDGIPQPFTFENFQGWKARAAQTFVAELEELRIVEIPGSISSDEPYKLTAVGGQDTVDKLDALTVGEVIYGPGLDANTLITNIDNSVIELSKPANRFGSFNYKVSSHQSGIDAVDPDLFDFKNVIYSGTTTPDTSVFGILWPNSLWPNSSLGFVEGVRDRSMYSFPVELPPGITTPANIYFGKDVFLDLSLNRILYHVNSLGLTSADGTYMCLCDLPWLDYVYSSALKSQRAAEVIHVGAQLSLVTDSSGYTTKVAGNTYTDPNIQANFVVIAENYAENPMPAYVQIGSDGSTKSDRFLPYDGDTGEGPLAADDFFDQLGSPLFEVPIGEYENILGKGTRDDITGDVTFTNGLADPDDPTNTYHVIQTSLYPQQYKNIVTSLRDYPLTLNSPALYALKRLPATVYAYQGDWLPATSSDNTTLPAWPNYTAEVGDYFVVIQTTTIGIYVFTKGDWIVWNGTAWEIRTWVIQGLWGPEAPANGDYYKIASDAVIGGYTFVVDQYIQWSAADSEWNISATQPASGTDKGTWTPVEDPARENIPYWPGMSYTLPVPATDIHIPTGSNLATVMATQFPYFIVKNPCTITIGGVPTACKVYDWLTLTGTPASPVWYAADGESYDALYSDIAKTNLTNDEYNTIVNARVELVNGTVYSYELPRRFLAKGSCNFQFTINPGYNAYDTNGSLYSLTSGPILWDATEQLFYVEGSVIDDMLVNTTESFYVNPVINVSNQFQVKPSVGAEKHYVKFREPTYYKNLGMTIGTVLKGTPNKITAVEDFAFPINQLSLTDQVISGLDIQIRNNYSATYENRFFNHYVVLKGMVDSGDAKVLLPLTGTGTDSDAAHESEFIAALQHLTASDLGWVFQSALARVFNTAYENKYYKNLLAVAGIVTKSDPSVLHPLGSTSDDIRAFSDAISLLSTGDISNGLFVQGGSIFSTAASSLPFTASGGLCTTSVECNQSSPLLWVAVGVNGQIAKSTDGSTWSTITTLPAGWGTSTIRKIKFAVSGNGTTSQWRIVGDDGKCAYSLDNTATWTMDPLTGLGWGSVAINDLEYVPGPSNGSSPGYWMIAGANGQVAHLHKEYATTSGDWVMSALPGADGVPVPLPPSAPESIPVGTEGVAAAWGTDTVRAVGYGNGVWLIGGGENNSGTNVSSLLARCTNLAGSPAWIFSYIGSDWNDYYVTDVKYGNGTWVVSGIHGKLAYSNNDAASWTAITLPDTWGTSDIYSISYEYGVWTITGASGKIATSTDGITWAMGSTPSSLSTVSIRASAHGNSASSGMEHILVGDTNEVAYSNSTVTSISTMTVLEAAATTSTILFDTDLATWSGSDTADKIVLLTLQTKKDIECELVGIPLARIPSFTSNDALVLSTTTQVTSYLQANRVFYPHLDPNFDLVPHVSGLTDAQIRARAGYPLYSEDPTLYYTTATNEPATFKNANLHTIYICNSDGNYVDETSYSQIGISSFLNYTTAGSTTFSDSRQKSYAPKYATYKDWINDEGALLLANDQVEYSGVVTVASIILTSPPSITFVADIPARAAGYNSCVLTIMPTVITGTVASEEIPGFSNPAILNTEATGIYIPDGGYGMWKNFDHTTDTRLPWEADITAFKTPLTPLVNTHGSPVYLCNADGTFRLDEGVPVQMQAPKYITHQELVVNDGRIIEEANLNLSSATYTITDINTTSGVITFSTDLPLTFGETETEKYVRLHLLTLASFEASTTEPNASRMIYTLPQKKISTYAPDRVCYLNSAYPSYVENPSVYQGDAFINKNSANVYLCDSLGNYIDNAGSPTTLLDARSQPKMPTYYLCQDWYMAEEFLDGTINNPYWQYVLVQDKLDAKTGLWSQLAKLTRLKKSERGTQLVYQDITTEADAYLQIHTGLEYSENPTGLVTTVANYINYVAGRISMILLGNEQYDPVWRTEHGYLTIEEDFEKYGIAFVSNFTLSNISSTTTITHATISGDLLSNYYTNTTKNFADPRDRKSSLVSISEVGVFNTDDKLIAYGVFPPIIYDSVRHHLSLNLFIKQGEIPPS